MAACVALAKKPERVIGWALAHAQSAAPEALQRNALAPALRLRQGLPA
ncbi:hypothetical protein [Rhodoferax lithotrophicus]|nr:hypothetical protein [Rhodoferax sp. MIZ03]